MTLKKMGLLFDKSQFEHGPFRRSDPDTSRDAGRAMTAEKMTRIKSFIMNVFTENGEGLTDEELADFFIPFDAPKAAPSAIRSRRNDLVQAGKLRDSGVRRLNSNGRWVIVWELSEGK